MSTESTPTKPFKPDKVSKGKMMSYGMGPVIQTFTWASYDLLLLYYYEVELGLSIALVGLSFVIYAIWNMVNDPLVGFLTDKPMRWSKKYGLRTPWIIVSGILMIISYYFLYAVPDIGDVKSNPWPLFWYMVIVTCIFDMFFSIFTTHYLGGFANIFRTKEDRRKGSMTMGLLAPLAAVFIRAVIIANVLVYGDPSSFLRAALLTSIICTVCLILFIPGIYENEAVKNRYLQIYEFLETQKMPYFKLLKITFKQKNYMIFLIAFTLYTSAQVLSRASELYVIRDVLGLEPSVLTILGIAILFSILPSVVIWSRVAKKIGHANVLIINFFLITICYSSIMFVTTLTHLVIVYVSFGIVNGAYIAIIFSIIADTNDEVVNAAGRHVEATLMGIRNFFLRVAYLVTGVIIAGIHLATGYVPGAETQAPLAVFGVRLHSSLVPAIFCLIAGILMVKFYDLKGEKKEALAASLRKKGL